MFHIVPLRVHEVNRANRASQADPLRALGQWPENELISTECRSTYGTARRAESRDGRAREGMSAAEERGLSRGRRYGLSTTSFCHLATGHGAMRVAKWNVVAISLVYPLMSNAGSSARRGDAASMAARTAIAMA